MLNVVSSGGMPQWQEVYLTEGMGNGQRFPPFPDACVVEGANTEHLLQWLFPRETMNPKSRRIIDGDMVSAVMDVSVGLTSEFYVWDV